MKYFPLFELSDEIQALVVERVARNSFQDLYGLKASSKSMKVLAERHRVYHFTMCYPFPGYSICLLKEGLSLMKRAADAAYECIVYIHAITRATFWCDGQYFAGIPRESVDRIEKLGDLCQCENLVERQCRCLWHIDVAKDDNMCDRCFWIKEMGMFLRDFEPISLFRDTKKW
ncbi:unnamed protein product [Brassica rapa subsp. narinosa]